MNNTGRASKDIPTLRYGNKIYPEDIANPLTFNGKYWYVDADNGSDSANTGVTIDKAKATIQAALTAAGTSDVIFVKARTMVAGATDPVSYAETLTIAAGQDRVSIIGIGTGRTQGGLPQVKKGSGSTALLTVRAPGCVITGIGFNGGSSTGGGILLDDDGSTKTAFGTTVVGCHFKNCVGSTATDSRTGGAIQWSSDGGAWQVYIGNNVFYKNVGDVVLKGTSGSVPQDVIIEGNTFQGLATSVDCHLYLAGGSGMASVTVNNNVFADVLPALGSGSVVRYVDMTGSTGMFSNNYVAGSYTTTGFGAAKAAAKIPTTVGIAHNYSDAGLIVREA